MWSYVWDFCELHGFILSFSDLIHSDPQTNKPRKSSKNSQGEIESWMSWDLSPQDMQHLTQHVTHVAITGAPGHVAWCHFQEDLDALMWLEGTILADYHKGKPPSLSLVNEI